jgi:hypothetical protein
VPENKEKEQEEPREKHEDYEKSLFFIPQLLKQKGNYYLCSYSLVSWLFQLKEAKLFADEN